MPTARAVRTSVERAGPRVPPQRASSQPRGSTQTATRPKTTTYKGGFPGTPTAGQVRTGIEASGAHAPGVSSAGLSARSGRGGRSAPRRASTASAPGNVNVPGVSSQAHVGALIAEFLLAEVFIWWGIFLGKKQYQEAMSSALWQSTAVVMVFFILALVSRGDKTSKAAVAFGALIDLGILFTATQNGAIAQMGKQITGKGTGLTDMELTAATTGTGTGGVPDPASGIGFTSGGTTS